jgi:hypothetical protein
MLYLAANENINFKMLFECGITQANCLISYTQFLFILCITLRHK